MRALLAVACCLVVVSWAQRSEALQCGLNEVAMCVQECPPEKSCRNRGIAFSCAYDKRPCTPKCICAEGYYRNAIGECITGAECDKCQKPNEFYSCNSACDNVCADIATQNRTSCPILNIQCNKWCYCDDGYARDAQGNCIPVSQCPKPVSATPGRYVRKDALCGPNEYFTCRLPCPPETCFSLVAKFRCVENQICKPQCTCMPGFLRQGEGAPCIPICECPQMAHSTDYQPCTGPNEVLACKTSCPPETCLSLVARFKCDSRKPCQLRCSCKPGYLRVADGSPCIPLCQCPELANSPDCITY